MPNSPDNSIRGGVYLSDVSPRDTKLDHKRAKVDRVRDLYHEGGENRLSDRLNFCARFLNFAVLDDNGVTKYKLDSAMFCHVRLCPFCQFLNSRMWTRRFLASLPDILEDYPAARFLFLTLTVKNCHVDSLNSTIKHLNKSWDRLTHYKDFRHVLGYVKTLEVTRELKKNGLGEIIGFTDYAHPHFHVILMVSSTYFKGNNYLSHKDWLAMWQKAARLDYEPSVNIKAVKPKPNTPDGQHPIYKAVLEVLKYSVKDSDLLTDSDYLVKLTNQLRHVRSKSLGGVFKEYLSEDQLNNPTDEQMIHDSEEAKELLKDKPHVLAAWREYVKRYQIIDPVD
jgi:plasmid rolling circle replication initiator protein Rep